MVDICICLYVHVLCLYVRVLSWYMYMNRFCKPLPLLSAGLDEAMPLTPCDIMVTKDYAEVCMYTCLYMYVFYIHVHVHDYTSPSALLQGLMKPCHQLCVTLW